jgi:hypothetical protein
VNWQSHMYHVCKSSKCVIILAFGRHAISLANLVQVRASSTGKKQALLVERRKVHSEDHVCEPWKEGLA